MNKLCLCLCHITYILFGIKLHIAHILCITPTAVNRQLLSPFVIAPIMGCDYAIPLMIIPNIFKTVIYTLLGSSIVQSSIEHTVLLNLCC